MEPCLCVSTCMTRSFIKYSWLTIFLSVGWLKIVILNIWLLLRLNLAICTLIRWRNKLCDVFNLATILPQCNSIIPASLCVSSQLQKAEEYYMESKDQTWSLVWTIKVGFIEPYNCSSWCNIWTNYNLGIAHLCSKSQSWLCWIFKKWEMCSWSVKSVINVQRPNQFFIIHPIFYCWLDS